VHPARRVHTVQNLKLVDYVIRLLEDENDSSIGAQLQRIHEGSTLEEKWEHLLVDHGAMLEIDPDDLQVKDRLCRDGFGNLFNLSFKTDIITNGASSALKAMPYDVVVWSNGPNGTNELGKGDDIVLVPYVGRSE
jgi:hypothetical protein